MQPQYFNTQRKRSKWPWILLGVGVVTLLLCGVFSIALIAAGGNAVNDQIEHGSTDLKSHVKIDSCKADQFGFATINFTVTNTGDSNQSYWIQFAINDSKGTRLSEAHGVVNNLPSGKIAKQNATGGEAKGKFVCVLERVN